MPLKMHGKLVYDGFCVLKWLSLPLCPLRAFRRATVSKLGGRRESDRLQEALKLPALWARDRLSPPVCLAVPATAMQRVQTVAPGL